jgi:hypothetical protein
LSILFITQSTIEQTQLVKNQQGISHGINRPINESIKKFGFECQINNIHSNVLSSCVLTILWPNFKNKINTTMSQLNQWQILSLSIYCRCDLFFCEKGVQVWGSMCSSNQLSTNFLTKLHPFYNNNNNNNKQTNKTKQNKTKHHICIHCVTSHTQSSTKSHSHFFYLRSECNITNSPSSP